MSFRIKARGEGDLKTRYRPQKLSEVCPTFHMKDAQSILDDPNASQVWLFEGLTGCGKTTLARIISRMAVCECADPDVEKPCLECEMCKEMDISPDFMEINGADARGIEEMRKITPTMNTYGGYLERKILIFDEAQQITPAAQELLNKVLEEPPEHVMIFLCTTNKKGLKRTLLGRCSKINFRRVTFPQANEIIDQVTHDVEQEAPDDKIREDMFRRANGSVRDLLVLLDAYIRGTFKVGSDFVEDEVSEGSPDIFALVKGLVQKDWETVRRILNTENVKNDPDGYRETVCSFLARDGLNPKKAPGLKMSIATTLGHLAGSLWEEPKREQYSIFVLRCMRACYEKKGMA